jgi:glutathione peroxidase
MKWIFLALFSLSAQASSLYEIKLDPIRGKSYPLKNYEGKLVLVTNIASRCGYTPQLEGLQKLYTDYKDKGLVILGFPSNEFGGQTPESDVKMGEFCKLNYGVTFPLMKKTNVKGASKHPLFKALVNKSEIQWNFEKFLISKDGKVLERFPSSVTPEELGKKIQKLL